MNKYLMITIAAAVLQQCSPAMAAEVAVNVGTAVHLNYEAIADQQDQMYSATLQTSGSAFVGLKALSYSSSDSSFNYAESNYFAAYAGLQSTGTIQFFGALGVGHLTNPDGDKAYGRLTDSLQFNIVAGLKFNVDQNIFVQATVDHISNCTQICNRSSANLPNVGRDFMSIGVGYKW